MTTFEQQSCQNAAIIYLFSTLTLFSYFFSPALIFVISTPNSQEVKWIVEHARVRGVTVSYLEL
jgi:hypothetical protein